MMPCSWRKTSRREKGIRIERMTCLVDVARELRKI
jgi:hypothetical protein